MLCNNKAFNNLSKLLTQTQKLNYYNRKFAEFSNKSKKIWQLFNEINDKNGYCLAQCVTKKE